MKTFYDRLYETWIKVAFILFFQLSPLSLYGRIPTFICYLVSPERLVDQ